MTQPDGIDMRNSGWTNPEGWTPQPRPSVAPPPAPEICEDTGPDGWVCDLRPGHVPAEKHWADNGELGGIAWERSVHDVSTLLDLSKDPAERPTMQGGIVEVSQGVTSRSGVDRGDEDRPYRIIGAVHRLAGSALTSDRAADWAVALHKIVETITTETKDLLDE